MAIILLSLYKLEDVFKKNSHFKHTNLFQNVGIELDDYKGIRNVEQLRSGLLLVTDNDGKTKKYQPVPPKRASKLQKRNATPKRTPVKKSLEQMVYITNINYVVE